MTAIACSGLRTPPGGGQIPPPPPLAALARVLEYPAHGAGADAALAAADALADAFPAAAARLRRLAEAAARDPAALEEAYVTAFDLAPVASPFVGDQLFGASQARHLFLARVATLERAAGVDPGPELADHLAPVLRLLAAAPGATEVAELARDGALPAARRMLDALEAAHHPYADALAAVVDALSAVVAAATPHDAAAATPQDVAAPARQEVAP